MKEKIVFLDASTVDYGDLDLEIFAAHGELITYPLTRSDEREERLHDVTIAITNKVVFDAPLISKCKKLKLIAVSATGWNNIDIEAARAHGITVANVPGYSTFSVAQFTMMFILALAGNLVRYNSACHDGTWSRSSTFTLGTWPTFDLQDRVLGILGMGAIGSEVARLADSFGMRVIALRREVSRHTDSFERYSLHDLAEHSDFVSVHMPLTESTRHLIDDGFFAAMKPGAFLINMARGPIVDPAALYRALTSGKIAGAAIDVMETEPPAPDDPLLSVPNLIITPHIAWGTVESRRRLISEVAENIAAFKKGIARNVVN